jgi:hypothetical protein
LKAESDRPTLSILELSLATVDEPRARLPKEALLDTGATDCAISIEVASQLGLNNFEFHENEATVLKTAVKTQQLRVRGKVKLNLWWKDGNGKSKGTRIPVFVVYGLSYSVLLSHDFAKKHPEVWDVAKSVAYVAEPHQLNLSWFDKKSKEQQKAEDEYVAKLLVENNVRVNVKEEECVAAMEQISGYGSSTAGPGPVPGSTTSGSTSS